MPRTLAHWTRALLLVMPLYGLLTTTQTSCNTGKTTVNDVGGLGTYDNDDDDDGYGYGYGGYGSPEPYGGPYGAPYGDE